MLAGYGIPGNTVGVSFDVDPKWKVFDRKPNYLFFVLKDTLVLFPPHLGVVLRSKNGSRVMGWFLEDHIIKK